jgi:NADH:ubiquinone oxidoreductase subunit 3 (subunit A)
VSRRVASFRNFYRWKAGKNWRSPWEVFVKASAGGNQMENAANKTITYKDVVFKYAVDVEKDKKGRIKKRDHKITTELNIKGFLEINREGAFERFFKAIHLAKEIEIRNNENFCKTFYINHRDEKWAETILYDQEVQNIIFQIFEPEEVWQLGMYENILEVKLTTEGEAELPEEVLNKVIDGMYKLRLKLNKFPSSEKFYDKADCLSVAYVLISLAIILLSVFVLLFYAWWKPYFDNYCDIQDKFRQLANGTMLYFVLPFLGFVVLLRGRRPDNVTWLRIFIVLTPVLYLCLWFIILPFANRLYTKAEISTYALVEDKRKEKRIRGPYKYYLHLSGWQERGGCFKEVRVPADVYYKANIGDQVAFSVKRGLFDVPYADKFKLVR